MIRSPPQPALVGSRAITSKSGPAKTAPVSTIARSGPPPPRLASDLDGKVYAGLGKPALPVVKHSKTIDESAAPCTSSNYAGRMTTP